MLSLVDSILKAFEPPTLPPGSLPVPTEGASAAWSILTCGTRISECWNAPVENALSTCYSAAHYCLNLDFWISKSTSVVDPSQLKPALQNLITDFFYQCNLPALPIGVQNGALQINTSALQTDTTALSAIGIFVALQPFVTNFVYKGKTELAYSLNRGIIAGAVTSWIFDQDPYLGAFSGAAIGVSFDYASSYLLKPVMSFLLSQYQLPHIQDTWKGSFRTLQHLSAVPVIGLMYQAGVTNPVPLLLGAGTYLYLLQRPISWVDGIFSHTMQFAGSLPSIATGALIGYGSLAASAALQPALPYLPARSKIFAFGCAVGIPGLCKIAYNLRQLPRP